MPRKRHHKPMLLTEENAARWSNGRAGPRRPSAWRCAHASCWRVRTACEYGVYHQAGHGRCSRFDVAVEFVRLLGIPVDVVPVMSAFFAREFFAPRPYDESLLNKRLAERSLDSMRDWKVCLEEYSAQFRADLARRGWPPGLHGDSVP